MEHKIAIKNIGSPVSFENTSLKYRCDLKKVIGCENIPEMVEISNGLFLLADEEGRMKNLKHNFFAFMPHHSTQFQTITGNAVFARFKPVNGLTEIYDYELDDLTQQDVDFINCLLVEELQNILKERFIKRYKDVDNPVGYWGFTVSTFD